MSDFLARLIDRALDRGPRLERRTPSLFEPSPVSAGPTDEAVMATAVDAPRPAEPRPREHPIRDADERGVERRADAAIVRRSVDAPAPSRALPAPPVAEARLAAAPNASPVVTHRETHVHERETRVERIERHTIERHETVREPGAIERHTIVERVASPAAVAPALRPDATLTTPPPVSRRVEPAAVRPRPGRERGTARPEERRAAPVRRALPSERAIEPAPASVTVSIGRVEIRAAPSARPASREGTAAAPKMNLEEYLRRRSGGAS